MRSCMAFLIMIAVSVSAAEPVRQSQDKPNILLLLADDLGYADVGFNGAKDIPTPKLDRLAKDGTVFSSAYVAHSFCGPSRAALMTGRYPQTIGSHFNLPTWDRNEYRDQGIGTSETMLSTVLQNAGYFTGIMGKWHLGEQPEHHPNHRGFDDFWGFLGGGKLYFGPYQEQTGSVWSYKTYPEHNGVEVTDLTEKDYMTDVLTAQGIRFLQEAATKDQPFFLFMSYTAPHTVLQAKPEDLALFENITDQKRRTYAAMVYAMDRGIGQLIQTLKAADQYDNTLIVFLSDNGGRPDEGADNSPLKKGKNTSCEGGYRVPMFFHWPEHVPAGQQFKHPVSALDLYPTFASLAEAPVSTEKLEGKNIWDEVLSGSNPRQGEMIYTIRYDAGTCEIGARRDQWKIYRNGGNSWELYNLDEDLGETSNLSAQYPERVQDMVKQAEKLSRTHVEPLWFNSVKGGQMWQANGMPKYDRFFQVD